MTCLFQACPVCLFKLFACKKEGQLIHGYSIAQELACPGLLIDMSKFFSLRHDVPQL